MPNNRVVITGGSGFAGTNLVEFFVGHGWDVLNLDIAEPRNRQHSGLWRQVDLLDRAGLIAETNAFQPSTFLHFGARTDLDEKQNLAGYAANIEGICNVIEAIRSTTSLERVVFASSQLVCRIGYTPQDEYDYQPSTLYGLSKAIGERIIRTADEIGATWTIVRPTSLWGPWFEVPYRNFFDAIQRNLYVHPGGETTRKQWGYIGNAVFQIWKLLQAPIGLVHKRTFYLADYEPVELCTFANKVQASLGAKSIRTVPTGILKAAGRAGDLLKLLGWDAPPLTSFRYRNLTSPEVQDLDPLQQVVGPLPHTVDEGIDMTVEWLREHEGV